jgi:hypothetical protein
LGLMLRYSPVRTLVYVYVHCAFSPARASPEAQQVAK